MSLTPHVTWRAHLLLAQGNTVSCHSLWDQLHSPRPLPYPPPTHRHCACTLGQRTWPRELWASHPLRCMGAQTQAQTLLATVCTCNVLSLINIGRESLQWDRVWGFKEIELEHNSQKREQEWDWGTLYLEIILKITALRHRLPKILRFTYIITKLSSCHHTLPPH